MKFFENFRSFFTIPKDMMVFKSCVIRSTYSWLDQDYKDFMLNIMANLEPRFETRRKTLIDQLDEP